MNLSEKECRDKVDYAIAALKGLDMALMKLRRSTDEEYIFDMATDILESVRCLATKLEEKE